MFESLFLIYLDSVRHGCLAMFDVQSAPSVGGVTIDSVGNPEDQKCFEIFSSSESARTTSTDEDSHLWPRFYESSGGTLEE